MHSHVFYTKSGKSVQCSVCWAASGDGVRFPLPCVALTLIFALIRYCSLCAFVCVKWNRFTQVQVIRGWMAYYYHPLPVGCLFVLRVYVADFADKFEPAYRLCLRQEIVNMNGFSAAEAPGYCGICTRSGVMSYWFFAQLHGKSVKTARSSSDLCS